ncbi:hypothetical protein [Psychromonas sp. 14N.309.X.WAT.B.A12]|uniref:hypothetical protein n=1 Tax=unclassified Psychromonas TaxID=2614957 RepID=UPI0025AFA9B4|nr:hypothetical protein [Psychromonas sp. 14N.309.X.WAT.B.A12]MDN2663313.1 hypothetical protein [Psychromonas sp. 14N.309.X.WAT.B.A12]
MPNIALKQDGKLSFKLTHHMTQGTFRRIDLYFSLPKEMGINKNTLSESDYFNAGIDGRRAYHTHGLHLPLLHRRFASRMKRSTAEYKSNLNMFAYQYISALETDANEVLAIGENEGLEAFYESATELAEHCLDILKKHRGHHPKSTKLNSIYENVDNYLSWFTEQTILRMLVKKPRQSAFSEVRLSLLAICESESEYRKKKGYNSDSTLKDANRIANKMRLLRRLIEYSVIFKSKTIVLGNITRKVVTGVATALLMSVVLVLIIKTQGAFSQLTALMVFILSIIYGVREVFKDDFKNILWRWIRKGKPKWARTLYDSTNQHEMAKQKVWLDYTSNARLPQQTKALLAERNTQNKQSAQLLHYRIESRISKNGFQAGYDTIEENILFSLRPLTRYAEGGTGKVFERLNATNNKDKIQSTTIERRYQINIIVAVDQGQYLEQFERYRITLNRSGIVEIVKAGEAKIKDPADKKRQSKLSSLLHIKRRT